MAAPLIVTGMDTVIERSWRDFQACESHQAGLGKRKRNGVKTGRDTLGDGDSGVVGRRRSGNLIDGGPVNKVFPHLDFKNRDAVDGELVAHEGENQVAAGDGGGWQLGEVVGRGAAAEHVFDAIGHAVVVVVQIGVLSAGVGGGPGGVACVRSADQEPVGIEGKRGEAVRGDPGKLGGSETAGAGAEAQ